jgi:transposase
MIIPGEGIKTDLPDGLASVSLNNVATKILDNSINMCYIIDTMHIDTSYSVQNGKTYVRHLMRDSYREDGKVKHRTIANLSHCTDQEIGALKLALKYKGNLAAIGNLDEIEMKEGMRIGAVFTLKSIADRIGLGQVLGPTEAGHLALWQVMSTLIGQGSRLKSVRLAESHAACDILGLAAFNEDSLYNNLAWLASQQENIEKRLFKQHYSSVPPQLFLYDVTSSYLEGVHNELADFGYNRDKKKGKMQIVIGLLTGADGTPLAVRVFKGNTGDTKTVPEQIRILVESFGVEAVTLVGDRGMLKQPEIEMLNQEHFHYITAIAKPQIRKLLREGVFQIGLFEEKLCEVSCDKTRYILRRNPARVNEIAANREAKLAKVKEFLQKQKLYLAQHPRAKVEIAFRKVAAKITQLEIEDWIQVTSQGNELKLVIDEAALKEITQLDGCYVIKTDVAVSVATTEMIHARYKDLTQVEEAFRTIKNGHLKVQPTYVRTEESTRGYVFVMMLAYLLERELDKYWRSLEVTVAEGIDELGSLRGIEMGSGQLSYQRVPEPTGLTQQLLAAADIILPKVLPLRKVHVASRKTLLSERK